jgi:hypothetical protein
LKSLRPGAKLNFVFVAPNLDFVAPGFDFVSAHLGFVALDLDFVSPNCSPRQDRQE